LWLLKKTFTLQKVIPKIIDMMNGSNIPFDSSKAQFSNMSVDPLGISRIYHKTYFEIKEERLVDTARTTIPSIPYVDGEGLEETPIDFVCNRPFLFLIHDDEYENIYFVGKYLKPEN
jgi:serine protease inhibitor